MRSKKRRNKYGQLDPEIKAALLAAEINRDCRRHSELIDVYAGHLDPNVIGRLLENMLVRQMHENRRRFTFEHFHFSIGERPNSFMAKTTEKIFAMTVSLTHSFWQRVRPILDPPPPPMPLITADFLFPPKKPPEPIDPTLIAAISEESREAQALIDNAVPADQPAPSVPPEDDELLQAIEKAKEESVGAQALFHQFVG